MIYLSEAVIVLVVQYVAGQADTRHINNRDTRSRIEDTGHRTRLIVLAPCDTLWSLQATTTSISAAVARNIAEPAAGLSRAGMRVDRRMVAVVRELLISSVCPRLDEILVRLEQNSFSIGRHDPAGRYADGLRWRRWTVIKDQYVDRANANHRIIARVVSLNATRDDKLPTKQPRNGFKILWYYVWCLIWDELEHWWIGTAGTSKTRLCKNVLMALAGNKLNSNIDNDNYTMLTYKRQ